MLFLERLALLDKLLDGTLDLAILRSDFPRPKLSYFSFALDHMVCLLPKQHPLAAFSAISLTQLKPEAFILMPAYTAVTKRAMSVCQKAGYVPEQVGMQQGIQVIRHNQMPLLQADEYVRQDGQKLSGSP